MVFGTASGRKIKKRSWQRLTATAFLKGTNKKFIPVYGAGRGSVGWVWSSGRLCLNEHVLRLLKETAYNQMSDRGRVSMAAARATRTGVFLLLRYSKRASSWAAVTRDASTTIRSRRTHSSLDCAHIAELSRRNEIAVCDATKTQPRPRAINVGCFFSRHRNLSLKKRKRAQWCRISRPRRPNGLLRPDAWRTSAGNGRATRPRAWSQTTAACRAVAWQPNTRFRSLGNRATGTAVPFAVPRWCPVESHMR